MTENSLKCETRRHRQKISNNQLIDKEESETDKSEHQPSVLGLIYTTAVNGGRPKGSTLKNKKNLQERMDEVKLHLTRWCLEENNCFKRLPKVTFRLLHNHAMTKYDLHETSLSIPVDTIRGQAKYGTTALKPGPFAVPYQIEPIILRYTEIKQECCQPMTQFEVIDCANSLITGSTIVTTISCLHHSNSKSPAREFGIT